MLELCIIAALAVWEIVEIWHHGSIFASVRAALEVRDNFAAKLLRCPFCLSVWVALVVVMWLFSAERLIAPESRGYFILQLPIYMFAVARLANVFNDVTHARCRTARSNDITGSDDQA